MLPRRLQVYFELENSGTELPPNIKQCTENITVNGSSHFLY